jgi:hypothetical protein
MTNEETLKALYNEHYKHQNNNMSIIDWLKKIEIEVQKSHNQGKTNMKNTVQIQKIHDQSYEVNLYRNGNINLTIMFKSFQDAVNFINGERQHAE